MSAIASNTLGRLCTGIPNGVGKYFDIACPSYAPSMTTAGDISVTGNLSAVKFLGDGSQLTGVTASAVAWDDIISIPDQVQQVSSSGSITMASVSASTFNSHYLSSTQGTIGSLTSNGAGIGSVNATRVSVTNDLNTLYLSATTAYAGRLDGGVVSATTVNGHYASFTTLTAGSLYGDGSGLTGITADATDRITSGTTRMVVVSDTGYVSLTQAGTNTGWFSPYTGLVTLGVSATGPISGSAGYFYGAVGIGTAAPMATLQVGPGISDALVTYEPAVMIRTDTAQKSGLRVQSGGGEASAIAAHRASDSAVIFDVKDNGKVGIGTDSPTWALTVKAQSGEYPATVLGNNDGMTMLALSTGATSGNTYSSIQAYNASGVTGGPLVLNGWQGNVGIHTTNPSRTLHVVGPDGAVASLPTQLGPKDILLIENNANANIGLVAGAGAASALKFYEGGSTDLKGIIQFDHTSNLMTLAANSLVTTGLTLTPVGSVSVTDALQVGSSSLSCNPSIGGAIRYSTPSIQVCNGGSWVSISGGAGGSAVSSTGAIQFNAGSGFGGDTNNLYWDNGNKRLGVGTNAPNQQLTVSDTGGGLSVNIDIVADNTKQAQLLFRNSVSGTNAGAVSYNLANDNMNFRTAGVTNRMVIDSSGNVGIGTTTPDMKLSVDGSVRVNGGITLADYGQIVPSGTTTGMNICGQSTGYPNGGCIVFRGANGGAGGTAEDGLEFLAGGNEKMRLTKTGSLGVGAAAPVAKLDVGGTISASDAIQVGSSSLTCNPSIGGAIRYSTPSIQVCNGGSWVSISGGVGGSAVSSTGAIQFNAGSGTFGGDTANLYWDNGNKRLGVGTSQPSATLEIYGGSARFNGASTINSGHGTEVGYWDVGPYGYIQAYNRSTSSYLPFGINGSKVFINVESGGNVGIGTNAPQATLQVSGSLIVSSTLTNTNPSLYVGTDGKVGVGMNSGGPQLDVSGTLRINGSGDGTASAFSLRNASKTGATQAKSWIVYNMTAAYGGGLQFWNYLDNESLPAARLILRDLGTVVIPGTGRLGIGTEPNASLDVLGTISATDAIQVGSSSLTCNPSIGGAIRYSSPSIQVCNGDSWSTISGGGGSSAVSNTGAIQFNAGGGSFGGDTANLYWDNGNKRLGVGTNAPAHRLEISPSGSDLNALVRFVGSGGGGYVMAGAGYPDRMWLSAGMEYDSNVGWVARAASSTLLELTDGGMKLLGTLNKTPGDDISGYLSVPHLMVTGNGNVGIGTATPSTSLHVFSSASPVNLRIDGNYADGIAALRLHNDARQWVIANRGDEGDKLYIIDGTVGGGVRMAFDTSGNVGIGTSTQVATLDIAGTISSTNAIQVGASSLTCSPAIGGAIRYSSPSIQVCNGGAWATISGGGGSSAVSNTGAIQFNAGGGTFGGDTGNLYWDNANKRLGVGTGAPEWPLDVAPSTTAAVIQAKAPSGLNAAFYLKNAVNSKRWSLGMSTASTDYFNIAYFDGSNWASQFALTIDTTNKVGIGTASPAAKLDVGGTISASDAIQVGTSSLTCAPSLGGAIRYSTPSIQVCNGGSWVNVADGGSAAAVSSTGAIQFNAGGSFGGDTANLYWDNGNKRLGVGTSNTVARFTVQGTSGADAMVGVYTSGGSGSVRSWVTTSNHGKIAIADSSGSDKVNIESQGVSYFNGGNVGIGTTDPSVSLDVVGSNAATGLRVTSIVAPGGGSGGGLLATIAATPTAAGQRLGVLAMGYKANDSNAHFPVGISGWSEDAWTDSSVPTYMTFETTAPSSSRVERMRITGVGNVGINNVTPTAKLDVMGTISTSDAIQVGSSSLTCSPAIGGAIRYSTPSIQVCNGGSWVSVADGGSAAAVSSTGAIQFNAGGSFGGDTANLYWDNGNKRLGVGTGAPLLALHVSSSSNAALYLERRTGAANDASTGINFGLVDSTDTLRDTAYIRSAWSDNVNRLAYLDFYTRNGGMPSSPQMRITAEGNVGIGTNTPLATLQVSGTTRITSWTTIGANVTPTAELDVYGTVSATRFVGDGSGLTNLAVSGDRITSGTLAMIANSPTAFISLSTAGTTWGYFNSISSYLPQLVSGRISSTNISATVVKMGERTITSVAGPGGNFIASGTTSVSTSSAGTIKFATNGNQRMVVNGSGNVGIGTANPNVGLKVVKDNGNGYAAWFQKDTSSSGVAMGSYGTATMVQGLNSDGSNIASLNLNPFGGNVGIGTDNPGSELEVADTEGNNDARVTVRSASGANKSVQLGRSSTQAFIDTQLVPFIVYTNGSGNFQVETDGDVVIAGSGTTCTIGNGTGATNCTSDARLKTDIRPIAGALDKLMLLKGVTFHWKDPAKSVPERIGVIAQEVEKVFPQAVGTVSDTTLGTAKTVDMAALVAPMIEAMKELKAANDNLKVQLEAAHSNDRELHMEMDALRKELDDVRKAAGAR